VGEILRFSKFFFQLSIRACCAMVPRWRTFDDFLRPVFSASHVQHISDMRCLCVCPSVLPNYRIVLHSSMAVTVTQTETPLPSGLLKFGESTCVNHAGDDYPQNLECEDANASCPPPCNVTQGHGEKYRSGFRTRTHHEMR